MRLPASVSDAGTGHESVESTRDLLHLPDVQSGMENPVPSPYLHKQLDVTSAVRQLDSSSPEE